MVFWGGQQGGRAFWRRGVLREASGESSFLKVRQHLLQGSGLILMLHAYKSVEDLFLLCVKSGKRETFLSPTRLSILRSEDKSTSELE